MIEVEPCARCGHDKHRHRPVEAIENPRFVSDNGTVFHTMIFGPCAHEEDFTDYVRSPRGLSLWLKCSCPGYVPSRFPRLTMLLGHDVVSAAA